MTEDIKVTFIIPEHCRSEHDCSEEMLLAFTNCEQHSGGGLKAQWMHEKKYTNFDGLTKRDVFVLSEFEGELYDKLRTTKCLVVGPRCLSCCLTEGKPIPSGPEPVYTVAMRGLVVTASGLSKPQKEQIKKKIFWMGGIYSSVLTDDTTHLVSDTVLSDKYIKSVEKGIPVMCESWVEAVWDMSLRFNINGAASDFDVHRLPAFANLEVTTSGISKKEKQMITKLVNENGGKFSGAFTSENTDIVILTKDGVGSEKYKAALEYGKACVLPSWVRDSASMKVALPLDRYKIVGASTSSPLAEHRLPDMSLNFSRITNVRPPSNFVDETRAPDVSTMSGRLKMSQDTKRMDTSMDKDIQAAFENLDMSCIKKAGSIFDGFCIWLTGLEGSSRERAAACVSRGGGVRYDAPHPRVTHVAAGSRSSAFAAGKALPAVPVLSAMWLVRSVEAGRAMDEVQFVMDPTPTTPAKAKPRMDTASPMSKRTLQLLRPPAPPAPAPPGPPGPPPGRDELVDHYLSQPMPEPMAPPSPPPAPNNPEDVTEITEDPTEVIEQIFRGIKIEVQGLDEEAICEVGAEVAMAGGALAAAGAGGRYALVPLDFDTAELVTTTAEAVTVFWVKDCLSQQELLPVQYYHRPVRAPATAPLAGVVASLSTYAGVERAFLDELAKLLGATTQLRFCRRNTANALASTHLICPTPVGDKFTGAVKWGLPAVTADWLMRCAEEGIRVPETPFLVGESSAPPLPVTENPDPVKSDPGTLDPGKQDPVMEPTAEPGMDKENAMLPPPANEVPKRGSVQSREGTPKQNVAGVTAELSPASRYIAMARQGLLGCSQVTPERGDGDDGGAAGLDAASAALAAAVATPPVGSALSTPNLARLSPTTRRRLLAVRRGEMPSDPVRTPDPLSMTVPTPDSGFGAALRPAAGRLSPDARKRLWKVVHDLPAGGQRVESPTTPLSEIRNRFLAQFAAPAQSSEHGSNAAPRKLNLQDQPDTPPAKMAKTSADQSAGGLQAPSVTPQSSNASKLSPAVDAQLQRLSAALSGLSAQRLRRNTRDSLSRPTEAPPLPESEPGPESQPNTVGWDDTTPEPPPGPPAVPPTVRRFMLSSNVDNREEIIEMIAHLGGEVLEGGELDLLATHLLCAAPGRSEKMLGSVAAGRWVLHPAYVARSRAAGGFLPEEEFEWGNPSAVNLPALSGAERALARAAHRWRAARAGSMPGPFAGVSALLHVPPARRRLLARLITAGDGRAPDDEPPYNNDTVTVCFADIKRYPLSDRDAAWLRSRAIPVCAPVLLSSYLTDDPPPNPQEHCLPDYRPK